MKPAKLKIHTENIPRELIKKNNWIVWKWEKRKGKWTKPPYQIDGKEAKSNDPSTWTDYGTAMETLFCFDEWDGVGFVLSKDCGYTGIDWDDCITDGAINPEIHNLINDIGSYTEISPSGKGLKTLVCGTLPAGGHHSENIGVFDSTRYFCITGHLINGFPNKIEHRQKQLDALIRKFWPNDFKKHIQQHKDRPITIQQSDQEIISKALSANDGGKFKRLWEGDTSDYASQSEADLALCCKLSFWVERNISSIDSLFRQSGLMRDKWEREDYRRKTIERAIEISSETYSGANITTHNKNITKHNIGTIRNSECEEKEKIGPTQAILNFLDNCSNREFSFKDCFAHVREMCGSDTSGPSVRTILHRMAKQNNRIASHERAGFYRVVSCDFKLMDLVNAKSVVTDIELPLELNRMVDLKAGQIVLVAGVTNTGKTSFMLDLMAKNMNKWRVRYINSEMDASEFRSVLDDYKGVKRFEDWKFEPIRLDRHMHPADLILPGYGNLNIIDYLEPPEAKFAADWVAQIHDRLDGAVAVISVQRHKDRDFGHGGAMLNSRPRLVLNLDWRKCTIAKVKFWKRKESGWNPNGMYFEWEMRGGWEPHKTSNLLNTQEKYDKQ